LPSSPPNTRLMQVAQRLRTASPPFAAFERNSRASPVEAHGLGFEAHEGNEARTRRPAAIRAIAMA
jgi:hypothetical protein